VGDMVGTERGGQRAGGETTSSHGQNAECMIAWTLKESIGRLLVHAQDKPLLKTDLCFRDRIFISVQ